MRLVILIYSALVVAGNGIEQGLYDDYDILPDQITFSPMLFLFQSLKLSWNDASSVCIKSYVNQTLVTAVNDTEVSTLKRTGAFTSMWLGLVSSSPRSPEPTWVTCQPYNDNDYTQPFQKENNTFNPTKMCALLTRDYMWEWRDCSEPHGFACNGKGFDGDANIPMKSFPTCGQSDVNYCPRSLPNFSCFPESHKPCMLAGSQEESSSCFQVDMTQRTTGNPSLHKHVLTDLKLTWNEASQACDWNGLRLAILDTEKEQEEYLKKETNDGLWIGLYRRVRTLQSDTNGFGTPTWVNCNEYFLNSSTNPFEEGTPPVTTHKLCALMVGGHFEWRDCRERHGFICEEVTRIITKDTKDLHWDRAEDLRSCPDPRANCPKSLCSEAKEEKATKAFCVKKHLTTSTEETTVTTIISSSTTINSPNTTNASVTIPTTTDEMSTSGTTVLETTVEDEDTTTTTELSPTPYLSTTTQSTPESSTITTTTTTKPSQFACNTSCNCRCDCVKTVYVSQDEWMLAKESKSRWISSILEDLTPNKSSLSSTRRRYKSAEDPRESVTTIGSLGVIFLVIVFTGILLLDMSALITDLNMLILNLRHVFHR